MTPMWTRARVCRRTVRTASTTTAIGIEAVTDLRRARVGQRVHIVAIAAAHRTDSGRAVGHHGGVAIVVAIVIAAYLGLALTELAWRSFQAGSTSPTVSATPLVYPQGGIALGIVFLTLQLVARLARLIIGEPPEDESVSYQVD